MTSMHNFWNPGHSVSKRPGEDHSKLELKKLRKFKSFNMVRQKIAIGGLGMLSPNPTSI